VITRAIAITAGRVPVLVGVTDPCVDDSLALARFSADAGASAVVASVPYYVPPAQDELESWVRRIAAQQPLPIFLYNIPILTKTAYAPDTVARLSQLDRVVGIKDSSGDLQNLLAFRSRVTRADFSFLIGAEALLGQAVLAGCHGCVGGGSMIDPTLLVAIYNAASQGHRDRVAELQHRILKLGQIYDTCGPRPAGVIRGIKTALASLGLCGPALASPFRPATPAERDKIGAILKDLSIP
jgi:4-hydroxy-tetrahydrodipicolinate synthase